MIHLKIFNYMCAYPGCTFGHEEETTYKYHRKIVHPDLGQKSDVRCNACDKPFPQKNKLVAHTLICGHKLKPFGCTDEECPKRYRSKAQLILHGKTDHPGDGEEALRLLCEFCPKVFKSRSAIRNHKIDKHVGGGPTTQE